jgi:hypothetical protein
MCPRRTKIATAEATPSVVHRKACDMSGSAPTLLAAKVAAVRAVMYTTPLTLVTTASTYPHGRRRQIQDE